MVTFDGAGFDWSFMAAEEVPTNLALMAFSDSEVNNHKTCSDTCLKSYETLKSQYDNLRVEFNKSEFDLATYKRGLAFVEEQLVFYKKNKVMLCDQIAVLKSDASFKDSEINAINIQIEKLKKEKESNQIKIDNFENASKNLDKLIGSQISDNNRKSVGYNAVPHPPTSLFAPPTINLSSSGLKEFQQPEFEGYRVNVSDCDEDESEVMVSDNVQHKSKPKPEQAKQPRKISENLRNNKTNWNEKKTQKLGVRFQFTKKACFGTGQREVRPVWNNVLRTNYQNFSNSRRNFALPIVLTKSDIVPISTARQRSSRAATPLSAARPINTVAPKLFVNVAKTKPNVFQKAHSLSKRPFNQQIAPNNRSLNNKVNTAKVNSVNTAKGKRVTSAVGEQGINAVKSSACWVWRPKRNIVDHTSKNYGSYICKQFDYVDPTGRLKCVSYYISNGLQHFEVTCLCLNGVDEDLMNLAKVYDLPYDAYYAHDVYYALKYDWKDLLHQTKSIKHIGKSKEVGTLRYLSLVVPLTKVGNEAVHKELGDRMERAATTASSLEAEHDSANLEFCNKYNMIAYLQKSEGSEGFHQIIDFLNASHIHYALIENLTIYVSFIKQFWRTTTARTSATREVELTATIDGQEKTITEASLRRYLKLEDNGGVTTLPNSEIFVQLALIGITSSPSLSSQHTPFTAPSTSQPSNTHTTHVTEEAASMTHESPLQSVHSLGCDEGSLSLHELMVLCTNLSNKTLDAEISLVPPHDVEIQEKISDDTEVLLEEEETTELLEEPTELMIVQKKSKTQLEQERLSHEEAIRLQEQIDEEERKRIARDAEIAKQLQEEYDKAGNKEAVTEVDTAYVIVWNDPSAHKSTKQLEQERLSHEEAIRLQEQIDEEERKRIARDAEIAKQLQEEYDKARKKEAVAEVDIAHVIDWNDHSGGYKMKDFKGMSYDDIRSIFEKVRDQVHSFVPTDSEEEVQRLKRASQDVEAKPAKRQRTKEVSESVQEQTDKEPKTNELSQEQLIKCLVQERYNSSGLTKDKEIELWVELKMLFEPNAENLLELQKYMHDPLKWWLYDMCAAHHVFTEKGQDIFMLVEKDYPLTKGLATLMLALQDPKVMTGTFSLNNQFATVLFDSGADFSFISTKFAPLLNMEPCIVNPIYVIEIADGESVKVDRIIHDCKLELGNSLFTIDLIPLGHESFDVIVGMDWLSKNKAVIVCHEKVVEIPIKKGGILRVHGERTLGAAKALMNAKIDEPRIK
ncbi:putative ribonuclease H-like domain-containing protein [Tanacetum coccineum]|uniref:Ribonuclease H-like domain-containing protein n=1 Tax=Tanacetum coccineum TaxID=301880 RepID=A0ABQ5E011_9ASTR